MYKTKEELELLVGKQVLYEAWGVLRYFELVKIGSEYYLPFCGLCKATTLKIYL